MCCGFFDTGSYFEYKIKWKNNITKPLNLRKCTKLYFWVLRLQTESTGSFSVLFLMEREMRKPDFSQYVSQYSIKN